MNKYAEKLKTLYEKTYRDIWQTQGDNEVVSENRLMNYQQKNSMTNLTSRR